MAIRQMEVGLKPVYVQNRKFIGSKYNLLSFIADAVAEVAPEAHRLADPFTGSGVVAYHFASRGYQVLASDVLYHNVLAARCFLAGRPGEVDWERVAGLIGELGDLSPVEGYCFTEFGGTYFTPENAGRIDAIREQIAAWRTAGQIGEQEEAILLTSLLYAADKVANTCGQYDAFLKHLGADPYSQGGTHLVDMMVYRPLELGLPRVVESARNQALCADADEIVQALETDILYLDPPYNGRQYVDNYHVLENIARWEKPALHGKTRKFERTSLKSAYSRRRTAALHMERLIERAQAKHILLSYNNEGIVPDEVILAALQRRGEVRLFTREYAIFGNGAGRSGRRPIVERLFHCRVR